MGFDQVAFDLYWLNFVQYVGSEKRNEDKYDKAEDYLQLLTNLDPTFVPAYFFAAFILGSERKQPAEAAKIIDRGIAANTNNWVLPFIAGVNQYLYAHDEQRAAKYYRSAAKFPDAPKWLGRQAEILEARIPSTIKEINIWDSIYRNEPDATVKERAHAKLAALWVHVYRTSPSKEIKKRALSELNRLGESLPQDAG